MKPLNKPAKEKLSKALKRLSISELSLIVKARPEEIRIMAKTILTLKVSIAKFQSRYRNI